MNGILRVVFDTNILFSAVGWMGNPHRCVQSARAGQCLSLTCEAILAEFAEKLHLKRGLDPKAAAEVANEVRTFSKMVSIPGTLRVVSADADDDAVLECALVGNAQYLVSGDSHLLSIGNYEGVQIVRAAEFLTIVQRKSN